MIVLKTEDRMCDESCTANESSKRSRWNVLCQKIQQIPHQMRKSDIEEVPNHIAGNGTRNQQNGWIALPVYDKETAEESGVTSIRREGGVISARTPRYGCVGCRTTSLDFCANIKTFTLCLCALLLVYGLLYSYLGSIYTTLEKQLHMNSKKTSLLFTANVIGFVPSVIVVSYYGGKGNRPRYIGGGMLLVATGSLLAALPHFIYDFGTQHPLVLRNHNISVTLDLCDTESVIKGITDVNNFTDLIKDDTRRGMTGGYMILFFSLVLIGIGGSTTLTLGMPYIDNNVPHKRSPIYIGIAFSARVFGPVLGYLLGYACTSVYVDITVPGTAQPLSPDNPDWIGAWWLGFIIASVCIVPAAVLMFGFPRSLRSRGTRHETTPTSHFLQEEKEKNEETGVSAKSFFESCKGLLHAIIALANNSIYRPLVAGTCIEIFVITGFFMLLPKYLETQFYQTSPQANAYAGIVAVLAMAIATMLGGWLVRQYKLQPRGISVLIVSSAVMWSLGSFVLMAIGCPSSPLHSSDEVIELRECQCQPNVFQPVCGDDLTYFSPCYAGCSEQNGSEFNSCLAVDSGTAKAGVCLPNCTNRNLYLAVLFIMVFYVSLKNVGQMMITIRCVDKDHKDMALGVAQIFTSLLGVIPSPVVYGIAVDYACVYFTEYCNFYNNDMFRRLYHGISGSLNIVVIVAYSLVMLRVWTIKFDEDPLEHAQHAALSVTNIHAHAHDNHQHVSQSHICDDNCVAV